MRIKLKSISSRSLALKILGLILWFKIWYETGTKWIAARNTSLWIPVCTALSRFHGESVCVQCQVIPEWSLRCKRWWGGEKYTIEGINSDSLVLLLTFRNYFFLNAFICKDWVINLLFVASGWVFLLVVTGVKPPLVTIVPVKPSGHYCSVGEGVVVTEEMGWCRKASVCLKELCKQDDVTLKM